MTRFDALLDVLLAVRRLADHDVPLREALERLTGELPAARASTVAAPATLPVPAVDAPPPPAPVPEPAMRITDAVRASLQDSLSGVNAWPVLPSAPDASSFADLRARLEGAVRAFDARARLATAHAGGGLSSAASVALAATSPSAADQRFWGLTLAETTHASDLPRLVAACEAVRDAGRGVVLAYSGPRDRLIATLELAAEAQATLRGVLLDYKVQDGAQQRFHGLLMSICEAEQIYIRHYLTRLPLPPTTAGPVRGLARRAASSVAALTGGGDAAPPPSPADRWPEAARPSYRTLVYHVRRALGEPEPSEHDLGRIADCLETIAAAKVPPSNRELREVFEDHLELLALVEGDAAERVLDAIETWIRQTSETEVETVDDATAAAWTEDETVREVRRLLGGRSVVVIGGDAREKHVQRLREGFAADVEWIASRAHESPSTFHAAVRREGVGVVCLLIRWASHSYEDVQQIAEAAGAAWVRVPAGYSPVQIARCIHEQASRHLARSATA